jgi:AcrR family transcriptional regulator
MGRPDQSLTLREQKKIRTRQAIRRAAMHLIETNGYANTTVEQIAEDAGVSASTFFRYFSSKQAVLMTSEIDRVVVSTMASQPVDIPTLQAFRRALEATWDALSEDQWEFEVRCRQLVLAIPELRELQHVEHGRSAATMIELECRRLGRDPDDFEVRVFFGALVGALLAAMDGAGTVTERLFRAMDFVEAGMSLH